MKETQECSIRTVQHADLIGYVRFGGMVYLTVMTTSLLSDKLDNMDTGSIYQFAHIKGEINA